MNDSKTPPLFRWLRLLAIAQSRGEIKARTGAVALKVAMTSTGTTGLDATVKDDEIAVDLAISVRTVWKHVDLLKADSWLVQTAKPTRGSRGQRGRVARYRLGTEDEIYPDLSAVRLPDRLHESRSSDALDNRLHDLHVQAAHDDPNRLQLSTESSAAPDREQCTLLPSVGTPDVTTSHSQPQTARDHGSSDLDPQPGDFIVGPAVVRRALAEANKARAAHREATS